MRKTFFLVTICFVSAWFFLVSPFVHLHPKGVNFKGNSVSANETTKTATIKEKIIQGVLGHLQYLYFNSPERHGKTYKVTIKDFDLHDEKTYAITDEDNTFWIIFLSEEESTPDRFFCCNEFRLDHVRKDLVTITRDKGLQFQFTVPVREEDLAVYKP